MGSGVLYWGKPFGGPIMPRKKSPMSLFKGKETYGEELAEAKAIKSGKLSPAQYARGERAEKRKSASKGRKH